MLYSIHFQFVLIADKCKITPKGENELLDVVYDFLLYYPLVNIFFVTLAKFLHIDKI